MKWCKMTHKHDENLYSLGFWIINVVVSRVFTQFVCHFIGFMAQMLESVFILRHLCLRKANWAFDCLMSNLIFISMDNWGRHGLHSDSPPV